ncbi:MAG: hypothetical protein ACJAUG_002604 [Halioglobus sp.]|jgi:hypothetical protein
MPLKLRVTLPFIVLLSACASSSALFNGKNLEGWQPSDGAMWSVQEGSIVSMGSDDGYLSTDALFGDFELSAEFWVDATTNSGIYIRCKDRENIHPETCYELNIWDNHPQQEARTGAIVFKFMPPLERVETIGRWSTYEVVAKGGSVAVKVNGVTTALLEDADPTPGFISLQHLEHGTVKFRNIVIKSL